MEKQSYFTDVQNTKEALLYLYEELRSRASELPTSLVSRIGCPLLSFPRDRWYMSKHRLLIVMQEPFNWGFNSGLGYPWPHPRIWSFAEFRDYQNSVRALAIDAYVPQMYELPSPYRPTPATRAIDLFLNYYDSINDGDVVTNNLFKCTLITQSKKSPLYATEEDRNQLLHWQRDCLHREVMTIHPTAVLFLIGPNYDDILKHEFPGAKLLEVVSDRDIRQFARVVHKDLPENSFRTYHPGYLVRSKKWLWLNELVGVL